MIRANNVSYAIQINDLADLLSSLYALSQQLYLRL